MVYYWQRGGSQITNSTAVDVNNLAEGSDQANVSLGVQVPISFIIGDNVTLVIDLRRTNDSTGRYFHNREVGRPWLALTYPVCIGGQCKSYLPVVLKNEVPPTGNCIQGKILLYDSFESIPGLITHSEPFTSPGTSLTADAQGNLVPLNQAWTRKSFNDYPALAKAGVDQLSGFVSQHAGDDNGIQLAGHPTGVNDSVEQAMYLKFPMYSGIKKIEAEFDIYVKESEENINDQVANDFLRWGISKTQPVYSNPNNLISYYECNELIARDNNDGRCQEEQWRTPQVPVPFSAAWDEDKDGTFAYVHFWVDVNFFEKSTFFVDHLTVSIAQCAPN